MVPAGDHMEIRESSRVRTPFSTFFMHDRIGTPVNWVLSAVGRAYLAYCPEKERERILAPLRKSGKTEDGLAGDLKRLDRILAQTRMKGYGVRDQSFVGGAYGRHSPDGLAGIAVPLLDGRRVTTSFGPGRPEKSTRWSGTISSIYKVRRAKLWSRFGIKPNRGVGAAVELPDCDPFRAGE